MAQFEGTIKEFNKFIGAFARIKVAFITAKFKKQLGKCEDCGFTNSLESAHIKGKESTSLIGKILSEFIEEDIIRIDLNEFEQRFVEIHKPFESTIRILCKDCHRKYDKGIKGEKLALEKTLTTDDAEIIEQLIRDQMNKSTAMKLAYDKKLTALTNSNTIFSNIISVQNGWWLQPNNDKFKNDLYIILNDDRTQKLYTFKLPANTIKDPSAHFKQRNDKFRSNCSDIYIPTSGTKFLEKNGFDFTEFSAATIEYH